MEYVLIGGVIALILYYKFRNKTKNKIKQELELAKSKEKYYFVKQSNPPTCLKPQPRLYGQLYRPPWSDDRAHKSVPILFTSNRRRHKSFLKLIEFLSLFSEGSHSRTFTACSPLITTTYVICNIPPKFLQSQNSPKTCSIVHTRKLSHLDTEKKASNRSLAHKILIDGPIEKKPSVSMNICRNECGKSCTPFIGRFISLPLHGVWIYFIIFGLEIIQRFYEIVYYFACVCFRIVKPHRVIK